MKLMDILIENMGSLYDEGDSLYDEGDSLYTRPSPLKHADKGLSWVDSTYGGYHEAEELMSLLRHAYETRSKNKLMGWLDMRYMSYFNMVKDVPIDSIIGTEVNLNPEQLKRLKSGKGKGKPPLAYTADNKNYIIMDGNHRVAAAMIAGKSSIKMHVLDLTRIKEFDRWYRTSP